MGWAKSLSFYTGQTPVLRYNRQLMQAILHDRIPIAKIVNATVIKLDEAPQGYKDFDKGAAKKFVIDPHGKRRQSGLSSEESSQKIVIRSKAKDLAVFCIPQDPSLCSG